MGLDSTRAICITDTGRKTLQGVKQYTVYVNAVSSLKLILIMVTGYILQASCLGGCSRCFFLCSSYLECDMLFDFWNR